MTVRRKGNIIMKLMGYKRENGTFGIRNHLLILPTSVCSSETAQRIAELVPGAVAVPHQHGCCQVGADYLQTVNTLVGFGKNPNVGAVLVVSLGCEGIQIRSVRVKSLLKLLLSRSAAVHWDVLQKALKLQLKWPENFLFKTR